MVMERKKTRGVPFGFLLFFLKNLYTPFLGFQSGSPIEEKNLWVLFDVPF